MNDVEKWLRENDDELLLYRDVLAVAPLGKSSRVIKALESLARHAELMKKYQWSSGRGKDGKGERCPECNCIGIHISNCAWDAEIGSFPRGG